MSTRENTPHSERNLGDLIRKYSLREIGTHGGMNVYANRSGTFFIASGRLITAAHVIPEGQLEEDFIKPGYLDLAISRVIDPSFQSGPRLVREERWVRIPDCNAIVVNQRGCLTAITGDVCVFFSPTELSEFQLKSQRDYDLFKRGVSGSPILREDGNVVGVITHGNAYKGVVACLAFASNLVVQPITGSGIVLE